MQTQPILRITEVFVPVPLLFKVLFTKKPNVQTMKTHVFVVLLCFLSTSIFAENVSLTLVCPDDVWADCDDELWNLSIYGNAYYTDYSGTYPAGSPWVDYHLSSTCNTGYIKRTWTVEDQYWNWHSCVQYIHVGGGSFNANSIVWPEDIILEGCDASTEPYDLPYHHDKPTWTYEQCSQIAVSHSDEVFHFGPDCAKIIRTWTLLDWCVYDPNHYGSPGKWEHAQIIKVSSDEAPHLYCPSDVKVESYDCDSSTVVIPSVSVSDSFCGGYYEITHNSPYADNPYGGNISGTYPIGTHNVTFVVNYGCSLQTTCQVKVVVEDAKQPVAYCYAGLAVALMPMDDNGDGVPDDGMVTIWASDINKDSYHPCGYGPLKFSFSPDEDDNFKTFTCEDVGMNQVSMYVTDPYGNQSFCNVNVDVQNNLPMIPDCEPTPEPRPIVSGRVLSPDGEALENTAMHLEMEEPEIIINDVVEDIQYIETIVDSFSGPNGQVIFQFVIDTVYVMGTDTTVVVHESLKETNEDGAYSFEDVAMDHMMYLMPEKQSCDLTRITLADAQVLHAYITGSFSFDDPYLELAADVDDNMEVNFDDLMGILRLLTGESDKLPCESPYWFIHMKEEMASEAFEMPTMEPVEVMVELPETHTYDWVAVMKGNLDELVSEEDLAYIAENSPLQDIGSTTSVGSLDLDSEISIRPNPASEIALVSLNGKLKSNVSIELRDLSGKLITKDFVNHSGTAFEYSIDVSSLNAGLYIIKVSDRENAYSKMMIKH